MGGYQNYGPFLGTLNSRCRIIIGTQKRTIILTSTHVIHTLGPICWGPSLRNLWGRGLAGGEGFTVEATCLWPMI